MNNIRKPVAYLSALALVVIMFLPVASIAQTRVKPGWNFFSIKDDVEFGREASREVEKQMPLVRDPIVQGWIDELGHRLSSKTSMPNLPWQFHVTNSREINAFALPGGFVYVNRGLIEITNDESELAGVLGHEMAHVTLRHGTNQLTKALLLQLPLAVLGQMKGTAGVIGKIGLVGMSLAFLKFSRSAEQNADILGVQTMTRAGYDPRGMTTIFEKLQREGGNGPQFLSDHPNPENRIKRIQQEISLVQVPRNPIGNSNLYLQAKSRLRSMVPAPNVSPRRASARTSSQTGEAPSHDFQTYRSPDGGVRVGYPSNWEVNDEGATVTFAPDWAVDGNDVTHGAIIGHLEAGPRRSMSTGQALDAIIAQLLQVNTYLREERSERRETELDGEQAMATYLTGRTAQGYKERVWVVAQPVGQSVVYILFIAPDREFRQYEPTFRRMLESFKLK
ncbi:MAG TPA: M48 family metalloprotease [Blastocatellia bacterium]|nr:M48 family metalloprotease [Blastocatellia bacterium]